MCRGTALKFLSIFFTVVIPPLFVVIFGSRHKAVLCEVMDLLTLKFDAAQYVRTFLKNRTSGNIRMETACAVLKLKLVIF